MRALGVDSEGGGGKKKKKGKEIQDPVPLYSLAIIREHLKQFEKSIKFWTIKAVNKYIYKPLRATRVIKGISTCKVYKMRTFRD